MQRTFKQVVKSISRAEKDVDKVLKAARLQRHEMSYLDRIHFDNAVSSIENAVIFIGSMGFMGWVLWLLTSVGR